MSYIFLVPDYKNFQRNLCPDFPAQQSAEGDSNLHQVVEPERKAGRKKMGQIPQNFCGRVLGFSKSKRLRHRAEFRKIATCGKKLSGKYLILECCQGPSLKLGISASSRFGPAVQRNRFKRLVREAFRLIQWELPQGCQMHVIPRKMALEASLEIIRSELLALLTPWLD